MKSPLLLIKLPFWNWFERMWNSEFDATEFNTGEYWICVFLLFLLSAVVFLVLYMVYRLVYDAIDKQQSTVEHLFGQLIDKRYKGEENHSGTGTAVIPNTSGGVGLGIVATSSHSPEEFLFFVRADQVYKIEVDMQVFYNKNIGDKLRFERRIGGLSKKELYIQLS